LNHEGARPMTHCLVKFAGAYIYRVDASAKLYQPDTEINAHVIAPKRVNLGLSWTMDASLKLGESVTSDGWTITVKETGVFGDVVGVTKDWLSLSSASLEG
jgi:hypothetical protein